MPSVNNVQRMDRVVKGQDFCLCTYHLFYKMLLRSKEVLWKMGEMLNYLDGGRDVISGIWPERPHGSDFTEAISEAV